MAKRTGDLELRRPAILVLLSASDTGNCCAANYERTVFRDARVVQLSKQFVCIRTDRTAIDPALAKRAEIQTGKPALVILDAEGLCFARWQLCANARDVARAMERALRLSKRKARGARVMGKRFEAIEKALADANVRVAGKLLRRFAQIKSGPVAGYDRAERMLATWVSQARKRVEAAAAEADVARRWSSLRALRRDYDLDKELVRDIRRRLKVLEEGSETGPIVREHIADTLIDEALARIAKGDAVGGRNLLRKVGRDYPDGVAASRAERELRRHTN